MFAGMSLAFWSGGIGEGFLCAGDNRMDVHAALQGQMLCLAVEVDAL